jgi:hypothetical protein
MSINKYIELYSANRNRLLYPYQSYYEVPFSSFLNNYNKEQKDPVVKGAVYYTFTEYNLKTVIFKEFPDSLPQINGFAYYGYTRQGTSPGVVYLDPQQRVTYTGTLLPTDSVSYSLIQDYYKGYRIWIYLQTDSYFGWYPRSFITSYDPTTGACILKNAPVSPIGLNQLTSGLFYVLYPVIENGTAPDSNGISNIQGIFIPNIDDNNNVIEKNSLIYNGYYIVNESPNTLSNPSNSNITAAQIYYYDNVYQVGYINKGEISLIYKENPPYTYTLRKSLPEERWTLPITTYFNTLPPTNPNIGPLIGQIITLPSSASDIDNYYQGKYVYFYNNVAEKYGNIYPMPENSIIPISDKVFYPIYGLYYIKAYNGKTKQLSISYQQIKYNKNIEEYPTYPTYQGIYYNQKFFTPISGCITYTKPPILVDNNLYITFDKTVPYIAVLELSPNYFVVGRKYNFIIKLNDISTGIELSDIIFTVKDNGNPIYSIDVKYVPTFEDIVSFPQTINFEFVASTTNITFEFEYFPDPIDVADPSKIYEISITDLQVSNIYYNSSSFIVNSGITSLVKQINNTYKALFDNIIPYEAILSVLPPIYGNYKYNICWCLKVNGKSGNTFFQVLDNLLPIYTSPFITNEFTYYTFSIEPTTNNVSFVFYYDPLDKSVEWSYFFVLNQTIQENISLNKIISPTKIIGMNNINITTLENENFSPLSYNGSMVDVNEAICYSVSLVSLTVPNVPLKTGSRISFYPYVYVELANSTSPSGASTQIIYSNNPYSNKALFIAPVTQIQEPQENTFINLSGGAMTQLIKFKPNDNLRFSVYLPDGSLFETLDIDTLPPYSPQQALQINAVFSIKKMDTSSQQAIP